MIRRWLPAILCVAVLPAALRAEDRDLLKDVKARRAIEAQRVEREFTDGRAAAYKLVRSDDPRLVAATEKLHELLAMVENDTSLEDRRRRQLVMTLKWDLDKVREIAAERRRSTRIEVAPPPSVTREPRREVAEERGRGAFGTARSIMESRGRDTRDTAGDRASRGDRFNRVLSGVDRSAIPEGRDYNLPRDWAELSRKRSTGIKMTAKEKAILQAMTKTIEVDFQSNSFTDVLDSLRKATGMDIAVDKRALDEASVTYESAVTLKMRASARTVIKRVLANLGLTYVIKDEAVLVTSLERARQMTTTRSYYIGDLAQTADVTLPLAITQLQMVEKVNRIITMIKQNVEPQSWKENNPEAPGQIYFDPASMSLVVKQTAEVHFLLAGK